MQMTSSIASLHSLGHDDQVEVQQDFFGHVTPLVPASTSHDDNDIVNSTTVFVRSR